MIAHIFILLLSLAGFILLLLAMVRHQQEWLRRKLSPQRSRALRRSGFALLALAFAVAGIGFGWAYGTVLWCGWLTVAAIATVTLNIHRDRVVAKVRR